MHHRRGCRGRAVGRRGSWGRNGREWELRMSRRDSQGRGGADDLREREEKNLHRLREDRKWRCMGRRAKWMVCRGRRGSLQGKAE